ncbi:hypothetical protein BAUCODRAFT_61655 [Baudoinia panamericana UAMH 10762]|uniref:HD/PDEase domain-containing protein n=1 Tax=Baudoinia panamericana (strain UAMH 10762) TaxID=717646 RepID=M2NN32_BAUPA|nr:uncharacterized protein BAUCODRAFT_61655 [Baudoinia panamericana UAMH 10762]EMD00925.1 hypothetical protein BAUCODRAFT_61655 [Baudoinia panamericana UAMH 10762]
MARWYPGCTPAEAQAKADKLLADVGQTVQEYMDAPPWDSSHDAAHIRRVLQLCEELLASEQQRDPTLQYDVLLVKLLAVLHDIEDGKFVDRRREERKRIESVLEKHGTPRELIDTIKRLIVFISCSYEDKHREETKRIVMEYPEVAIVADADRLDGIGAVGLGRCFVFNAVKGSRLHEMGEVVPRVLLHRHTMIKTAEGIRRAETRQERMVKFVAWWKEEYHDPRMANWKNLE